MEKNYSYIYGWLDKLCSHDLNPELVYPGAVDKVETETMRVLINQEIERVEQKLKDLFFNERKDNQLSLMVQTHHDILVIMMDRVHQHKHHSYSQPTGLHMMLQFLMSKLDDLLTFFESNFGSYMRKSVRVPQARLVRVKRELLSKWEDFQDNLSTQNHSGLLNIIHEVLRLFINRIDGQQAITLREVKYHRRLIDDLLKTPITEHHLRELLIYRNLNNDETSRYLTKQLDQLLAHMSNAQDKIDVLRLEYKAISQLRVNRKQVYDPNFLSLKQYLCGYIDNELGYLEQKIEGLKPVAERETQAPPAFKVMCNLSIDQLALILRAADESRLLMARSMNMVFKTIVPYLSTAKRQDISVHSMRTKSYDAEQSDKEKVVAALEDMIRRIKDY